MLNYDESMCAFRHRKHHTVSRPWKTRNIADVAIKFMGIDSSRENLPAAKGRNQHHPVWWSRAAQLKQLQDADLQGCEVLPETVVPVQHVQAVGKETT